MDKALSPSLMCADLSNLKLEIGELDAAGVDSFHIDIMDGEFVPNFAMSWSDVSTIRKLTDKPLEVHLMVKKPDVYLPYAFGNEVDIIYVHYESHKAANYLYQIKDRGALAGLAVNPETPFSKFRSLLPLVDWLLIMRVHPGFAGRSAIPEVEHKIEKLVQIKEHRFRIALDGAVSPETITKWSSRGVEKFVLGTSSGVFGRNGANRRYSDIIHDLRRSTDVAGSSSDAPSLLPA